MADVDCCFLTMLLFFADILLYWICILLPRIIAQYLGYSGWTIQTYNRIIFMVCVVLVSKTCFICYYLQQVYMYFRGSGKAAEMKRDAARGTMRAAL